MLNKKALLSVAAFACFTSCVASQELSVKDQFLKKTNTILSEKIDRAEVNFRVDGKAGSSECWIMTREQFQSLRELMEYAVAGYNVVEDETNPEIKHIVFTNELGLVGGEHFCGVRKAKWFEKIVMCIKEKSIDPFVKDPYIFDANAYTHVAIKADLQVKEFQVVNVASRLYRNVPETSQIGNLPGVYLRGNGKTARTGDLVGFSFRPTKDGQVYDYFFGKLWIEETE